MDNNNKTKIFLVDDDRYTLNITEKHLRNIGYQDVSVFDNGTECLNRLTENPDIIFLDHNMDVLNGFEVLKKIKRFKPNAYVIMLSSQENIKTAVNALKFGAFDYLIKGDNEEEKIADALQRIESIQTMLKKEKPKLFKLILSLI